MRRLSASCGLRPAARWSRPSGPKAVLAQACVATAPMPARAQGTTAPTAMNLLCTATPSSPVAVSHATIENVATIGRIVRPSLHTRRGRILTLHTAKAVGFLLRRGVPPSVVLPSLHKRFDSPRAPRRAGAAPHL